MPEPSNARVGLISEPILPPCCELGGFGHDQPHAAPYVDPDLGLEHGERSTLNADPLPHDVPGTGGWNGLYNESPDTYCMCGHPNYLSCMAYLSGGGIGGAIVYDANAF